MSTSISAHTHGTHTHTHTQTLPPSVASSLWTWPLPEQILTDNNDYTWQTLATRLLLIGQAYDRRTGGISTVHLDGGRKGSASRRPPLRGGSERPDSITSGRGRGCSDLDGCRILDVVEVRTDLQQSRHAIRSLCE